MRGRRGWGGRGWGGRGGGRVRGRRGWGGRGGEGAWGGVGRERGEGEGKGGSGTGFEGEGNCLISMCSETQLALCAENVRTTAKGIDRLFTTRYKKELYCV